MLALIQILIQDFQKQRAFNPNIFFPNFKYFFWKVMTETFRKSYITVWQILLEQLGFIGDIFLEVVQQY
jgi:hypothetical protein